MEDATIIRLEKAQYELQCAQMKAAVSIVDVGDKAIRKPLREDNSGVTDFVLQQRTASRDGQFPEYSSSDSVRMNGGGRGVADDLLEAGAPYSIPERTTNNLDEETRVFRGSALPPSTVGWEANMGNDMIASPPQSNDYFRPLPAVAETSWESTMSGKSPILPTSSRSNNILRMNSEGRFFFDSATTHDEDDASPKLSKYQSTVPTLRRRANTAQSAYSEADISQASNQWNQVNSILRTTDADDESSSRNKRDIETGVWVKPSFKSFSAAVKSDFL